MSNFFEQELRKLFADSTVIEHPHFVGRACLGSLGNNLRVRVQFITTQISNQYDALRITIMNRTGGVVDKLTLRMDDVLGIKKIPNNPNFREGVSPHIWIYNGTASWYAYQPTATDYLALREAAASYVEVFRKHEIVPQKQIQTAVKTKQRTAKQPER